MAVLIMLKVSLYKYYKKLKVAPIFGPAKLFDSLKPFFTTTTLRNIQNGYQPKIKRVKRHNKKTTSTLFNQDICYENFNFCFFNLFLELGTRQDWIQHMEIKGIA